MTDNDEGLDPANLYRAYEMQAVVAIANEYLELLKQAQRVLKVVAEVSAFEEKTPLKAWAEIVEGHIREALDKANEDVT